MDKKAIEKQQITKEIKHKITFLQLPWGNFNILNWYENGIRKESVLFDNLESLIFLDLLKQHKVSIDSNII